jgi:hypothetical protein
MVNRDVYIDQTIQFLNHVGICTEERPLPGNTFLAGICIEHGTLLVDRQKLSFPGDILHEAGHIATTPSIYRADMNGDLNPSMNTSLGDDIAAILWSYAALKALGLPPEFLFHEQGYKGASEWYIENFGTGNYVGLPLLEWMGMTYGIEKATQHQCAPYPAMIRWLRE